MERELNCGKCPHLRFMPVANMGVFGCGATEKMLMVPHKANNNGGSDLISATFWRVPEFCPRSGDEVEKRHEDAQPPMNTWTPLEFSVKDIPETLAVVEYRP